MNNNNQIKKDFILNVFDKNFSDIRQFLIAENEFQFLLAVVLSANCSDDRVNSVTGLLFNKVKTPSCVLALGADEIQKIIFRCGQWRKKSAYLIEISKMLKNYFNGNVPYTKKDLLTLPGVGIKTAEVFLSQVCGLNEFPVDRHIKRLARRWEIIDSQINSYEKISMKLKEFFHDNNFNKIHLQMISYGRKYCKSRIGTKICCCEICAHFCKKHI